MSSIVRAILAKNMKDIECVEEALEEMKVQYTKTGETIQLQNEISLRISTTGVSVQYRQQNQDVNRFIEQLQKTYDLKLEEKIQRIKLEEAKLREQTAMSSFSEEERIEQERILRRERIRLEEIKKREQLELTKKRETIRSLLIEKASRFRYSVRERMKENDIIIELMRK